MWDEAYQSWRLTLPEACPYLRAVTEPRSKKPLVDRVRDRIQDVVQDVADALAGLLDGVLSPQPEPALIPIRR